MRIRFFTVLFMATKPLCGLMACNRASRPEGPAIDDAYLREVMVSLPSDSQMRRELERGAHGNGVSYPWMAHMQQLGVRRAMISTEFIWLLRPFFVRVPALCISALTIPIALRLQTPDSWGGSQAAASKMN
jgi:hypothetical protein